MTKKEKEHICDCEEHGGKCVDGKCVGADHDCKCKDNTSDIKVKIKKKKVNKEQEYLDSLQRLQAEFENYRKRNALLAVSAKQEGTLLVVERLLPVLDSFNVAIKNAQTNSSETEIEGLKAVHDQLISILKSLGIEKIESLGNEFDPNLHNAIMVGEEEDKYEEEILEVFQEGYMLKDKVIRYATVKINKLA